MRNPAQRAAEYAARPLFMRETGLTSLARVLSGPQAMRRPGLLDAMGRLLRPEAGSDAVPEAPNQPEAYVPRWMGDPDDIGFGWVLKDGVAVMDVWGVLWPEGYGWDTCWWHGYDTLRQAFDEVAADARVRAVLVRFDTPGGILSSGLPELARYVRETFGRAGGKPVWAVCEAAYSAGYWLAAQCDRLIAPREGGVGSIGVVITHMSIAGMLEQDGIVVTPIEWPVGKTDGAWHQPLSETAKAAMLAEVKQGMAWFTADVVAARPGLTADQLLGLKARCFYGDADDPALSGRATGLVDDIMTERAAFEALRALAQAGVAIPSPAASAAPAAATEIPMNRSKAAAAMKAAGMTETQIAAALAAAEAAETPADEPEGDDAAEGEDTQTGSDDPDPAEGEEGEDQTEAHAPDGKTVLAILALPSAKGREALAQKLAGTPGMTAAQADGLLKAAPRAGGLQVEDPQVSSSGGASSGGDDDFAQGKALAERVKAYRGPRR